MDKLFNVSYVACIGDGVKAGRGRGFLGLKAGRGPGQGPEFLG